MIDYTGYENALLGRLWGWADRYHLSELDGGRRTGRPPVLRAEFASKAVLVPSDPTRAPSVVSTVPQKERHKWFRSFKSSQALAQSVFGAIGSFGRLGLLDGVIADCGRPAFLEEARGASLVLEHKVRSLGEPGRTSVDMLLEGPSKRVAVECTFTERKFGVYSRTQLRPGDRNYAEQHCDGNYRVQRGRLERCALTEIRCPLLDLPTASVRLGRRPRPGALPVLRGLPARAQRSGGDGDRQRIRPELGTRPGRLRRAQPGIRRRRRGAAPVRIRDQSLPGTGPDPSFGWRKASDIGPPFLKTMAAGAHEDTWAAPDDAVEISPDAYGAGAQRAGCLGSGPECAVSDFLIRAT